MLLAKGCRISGFTALFCLAAVTLSQANEKSPHFRGSVGNKTAEREDEHRDLASGYPSDAFTILFISDMETEWRRHNIDWCNKVVGFIRNLASMGLTYDGSYASYRIAPDFVVHGGDISDGTSGTWKQQGSNAESYLYSNVWQQLYDAGIPLISAVGNHDVDPGFSSTVNNQANQFSTDSYSKTQQLLGSAFSYISIPPVSNAGAPKFISVYRGVQIANLNYHAFWQDSQGQQLNKLSNSLDPTKKTIFISHFPLSWTPNSGTVKQLVWRFPNSAFFSGHIHIRSVNGPYTSSGGSTQSFYDYTAAYPHPWENPPGSGNWIDDSGFYAALVSPTAGVLQVKHIHYDYQQLTGCLPDGTSCAVGTTCNYCCHDNRNTVSPQCGVSTSSTNNNAPRPPPPTTPQAPPPAAPVPSPTAASAPSQWPDGARCVMGTTCNYCQNMATYWPSLGLTACGTQPSSSVPTWPDGTRCAMGTTCNNCRNSATYWQSLGTTACGQMPTCLAKGTTCRSGSSCNNCCTGNRKASCPSYWHGICRCG